MLRTKSFPAYYKADPADPEGSFEAVVAVFGNIDLQGDRIVAGAFADNLAEWRSSGDPIPVIHSHQWFDLNAHIGAVDPADAEELTAGDARLPAEIRDLGGLYVKGQLDIDDDPAAQKAHRLMSQRRLKEFSFAYDIRADGEERGDDGVNELRGLDIIEVGPTLKGANPATQLIGAKAIEDLIASKLADALQTPDPADGEKATVNTVISGTEESIEAHLAQIADQVRAWAQETFSDDLYWVDVEATMTDHLIAYVELWHEPLHGGTFYRIAYSADGDQITLEEPEAVNLELTVVPKSHRTAPRTKAAPAVEPATPEPATAEAAAAAVPGGSLSDSELLARVRAELAEVS